MTGPQIVIFAILAVAMVLFVTGRWRYDLVAVLALLAGVYGGVVPADHAFIGFGHPAVVTVAAVLVISQAMQISGLAEWLGARLVPRRAGPVRQVGTLSGVALLFSAFMNNVGALALMLPVAIRVARITRRAPSRLLMPLSFASLLGGLLTLIGTPPNIVIASYREEVTGTPFAMFDFTPVGAAIALPGLLYLSFVGWRLLPRRGRAVRELDRSYIRAYITETRVPAESDLVGAHVSELEDRCGNEVSVMGILRDNRRLLAPAGIERVEADDVLILQGDPAALRPLVEKAKLEQLGGHEVHGSDIHSPDVVLMEAVVLPHSPLDGRSARGIRMHERYGVNLLGLAREGKAARARLGAIRFRVGDVLLMQGERHVVAETLTGLRCLALAPRDLDRAHRRPERPALAPLAIFAAAVGAAAVGAVSVPIAFVSAVAVLLVTGRITLRDAYRSVEWPVVVLLGALIPLGEALHATGGTALIAQGILHFTGDAPAWTVLALLMATSMVLSDLVHNTPTAVLMAPVAAGVADAMGLPVDAFLMAVAVGAGSPYLTPIGHQSNTLVMAPGGYRFGDYARMGLPLDAVILATGVPAIAWIWL